MGGRPSKMICPWWKCSLCVERLKDRANQRQKISPSMARDRHPDIEGNSINIDAINTPDILSKEY